MASKQKLGPFTLDSSRYRLSMGDETLDLSWRCVQALTLMVEARGEVVAKEILMEKLWPGLRVEESSLHRCVSQLRRAMRAHVSDDWVETAPRLGYRWVGPAATALLDDASEATEANSGPVITAGELEATTFTGQRSWPLSLNRRWFAGAALIAGAGMLSWGGLSRNGKAKAQTQQAALLCIRGRELWKKRDAPSMIAALDLFQEARALDPGCARAYSGIADILVTGTDSADEALWAAGRAVTLDPGLAEGHASLGFVQMSRYWRWKEGLANIRHAVELDPGYVPARHWLAFGLAVTGAKESALREIDLALQREPLSANLSACKAMILYFLRRFEEAKTIASKALNLAPGFHFGLEWLARTYLAEGDWPRAVKYLELRQESVDAGRASILAGEAARRPLLSPEAAIARLRERRDKGRLGPFRAMLSAHLGGHEDALRCLEASVPRKEMQLFYTRSDPAFDAIRESPRFQRVLEAIGLASL